MKTHRKLSKVLALCLAVLMTACLFSTTALAITEDETGIISVSGVKVGATATAYRLMNVDYNYTADQPVQPVYTWTDAVADWVRKEFSGYIGAGATEGKAADNSVQIAFSTATTEEIALFYDKLAAAIKLDNVTISAEDQGSVTIMTADEGKTTGSGEIADLPMGNYLILIYDSVNIYKPSAVNLVPTYNEENQKWEMTSPAEVELKSELPQISKTVGEDKTATSANIGESITFKIEADVPDYPANSIATDYYISDILLNGLTFNTDSIEVRGVTADNETGTLLGDEGEDAAYTIVYERPTGEEAVKKSSFTLNFDYDKIKQYSTIRVTYTATLNESAVLGTAGNPNNAYLDYSNDPYTQNSYGTDNSTATVYTYGMDISKVDEEQKDGVDVPLSGAKFELYTSAADAEAGNNKITFVGSAGSYRRATATDPEVNTTTTLEVDSDTANLGKLILTGLKEGTYYLKETEAPAGYNLLAAPAEVTIKDVDIDNALDGAVEGAAEGNEAYILVRVENDDGFQLPVTGGIGTILFTAVGVALMGTALVLLLVVVIKKRKTATR